MKNGPIFLLGLFVALTLSWAGLVLGSNAQLGALSPYYDEGEAQAYPQRVAGIASRGQLVYADLGCAACHTQQVRRPDYGSDQARGWGERQSVARDYIFQALPQLGASRFGPDLTNLAARKPPYDTDDLMKLLYTGSSFHPPYKFIFEERKVSGEISSTAIKLPGNSGPVAGFEIVPTERARSLVAYLLSLNTAFDYPEARPIVKPAEKKHEAAPGKPGESAHTPAAPAANPPSASKAPAPAGNAPATTAPAAPAEKKGEGEKK